MLEHLKNTWQRVRRYVISAFILFFFYSACVGAMLDSRLKTALMTPVQSLVVYFGLVQNFLTFSPEPPRVNRRLFAHVKYDDGSTTIWNYPEIEALSSFKRRLQAGRYRTAYLRNFRKRALWPSFARYVAEINDTFPNKHPVKLTFIQRLYPIPKLDPLTGTIGATAAPKDVFIFEYNVADGAIHG